MFDRLQLKSDFSKNVLTLMSGTTIAQALPIVISPILTRLYSPEHFGLFALYMSILSTLMVMVNGRYELSIVLPKKKSEAINLVVLSFFIVALTTFLAFIFIYFFHDKIGSFLGDSSIESWLCFLPLSMIFLGVSQTLNYWNNREKNYPFMAKVKISQSTTTSSINVILGSLNFMGIGLVMGQLLGQTISFILFSRNFYQNAKDSFVHINRLKIIALAKRYKNFPLLNMPHAFLNTFSTSVVILIISRFFTPEDVGFYSLANMVLLVPMGVVAGAYTQVFFQKMSHLKGTQEGKEFFKETFFTLSLYALPFFILAFFLIEDIFTFVFGEKWIVAGVYSSLLIPMLYFRFIGSIISSITLIYHQQKKGLILEVINLFIRVFGLSIGVFYHNLILGIILFSLGSALVSIYRLFWYYSIVIKGEHD